MDHCQTCGNPLAEEARFCANCGAPVPVPPGATPVVVQQAAAPGSPGIGVAGFVLALVGLFVPVVGGVGFIFSIVGYRQAKREGLSTGLSLAGIIIGAIATLIGIIIVVLFVGAFSFGSSSSSSSSSMLPFIAWWA